MTNKRGSLRGLAARLRLSRGRPARLGLVSFLLVVIGLLGIASCQQPDPTSTATFVPPPTVEDNTTLSPTTDGYPPAQPPMSETPTAYPTGYPPPPPTATATPAQPVPSGTIPVQAYMPLIPNGAAATTTPTPSATATPQPTPTPTIDFAAVRAQLQAQGQDLGFVKMGFHTGAGGNRNGIGEWMRRLDSAKVPFFIKSADDASPLIEAQEIVRSSDVPHTIVFRQSGDAYDTPNYSLPPAEAAAAHWQLHMAAFPPELDPSIVWLETINEVDKNESEWLAQFALATARLALDNGYRWAAFGWSSGEPEVSDWQSPAMLEFLRLAAANPDRLAIALHEYSYLATDIGHEYPYKVGRFQLLFEVCDQYGIPRPTVLISEWGWEYQNIPETGQALQDIEWAAGMYAPYPQIRGAAIWYLGGGFADIHDQTQRLVGPMIDYALGNYFTIPLPPEQAAIEPQQFQP